MNQNKHGDYCGVFVQSKVGESSKAPKTVYMVIGKLQCFGDYNSRHQVYLSWPWDGSAYRATVLVLGVKPYTNLTGEECLEPSDNIIGSLPNVDSRCITLLTPSNEAVLLEGSTLTKSHFVMKLDNLKAAFDLLSNGKKHHVIKGDDIKPIAFGTRTYFMAKASPLSVSQELLVCNICVPPKIITRPCARSTNTKFRDDTERQRACRGHMASHHRKGDVCKGGWKQKLSYFLTNIFIFGHFPLISYTLFPKCL